MKKVNLKFLTVMLALAAFSISAAMAAAKDEKKDAKDKKEEGEGIQIKLGKDINRDWKDVMSDKYAYGPKQDYDSKTKVTHIYLPYGNNLKLYGEVTGRFTDPVSGHVATFHSVDGSTNAILTYKLVFDKPIGDFILAGGHFEYGLNRDTCAGVEFSIDGNAWRTIREVKGTTDGVDEGTIDSISTEAKVEKLKTRTLYIRYYSRSIKNPKELFGPARWIKLWMAGDPAWGDVATTFFKIQPQIWVTAAK
ncbi:MAG TPA: hypothetical protein DCZ94_02590 [Lentisphaeria bacterium]|nr:MAG: hypothetical protein A2X48_08260 [Lentisphaerae bacterium GWF2_49_21]HBC85823.1 hypothetical protein [Lentisphaeria bacterium]